MSLSALSTDETAQSSEVATRLANSKLPVFNTEGPSAPLKVGQPLSWVGVSVERGVGTGVLAWIGVLVGGGVLVGLTVSEGGSVSDGGVALAAKLAAAQPDVSHTRATKSRDDTMVRSIVVL